MGNGALVLPPPQADFRRKESVVDVIDNRSSLDENGSFENADTFIESQTSSTVCNQQSVRDLIMGALKQKFMFKTLDTNRIQQLVDSFKPLSCAVGEVLIKEGDEGDFMYIVEDGLFDVFIENVKVSQCKKGDTFGELALMYHAERSATVTCIEEAKIWSLDRHVFKFYQQYHSKRTSKVVSNVLSHLPLFQALNKFQLTIAEEVAQRVEFKKGDRIITQGEVGDTFFIIIDGSVVCTSEEEITPSVSGIKGAIADNNKAAEEGLATKAAKAVPLKAKRSSTTSLQSDGITLSSGDYFGEIALLNEGAIRTANVIAQSELVHLVSFDRHAFEYALGSLKDIIEKKANERTLYNMTVLENLPDVKREEAVTMFQMVTFQEGEVIAQCGATNARYVYVKSGKAVVWKHPKPKEITEVEEADDDEDELQVEKKAAEKETEAELGVKSLDGFHLSNRISKFTKTRMGQEEENWRRSMLKVNAVKAFDKDDEFPVTAINDEYTSDLKVGEFVGAQNVIEGSPMDCTVIARGEVVCFIFTRADMARLLEEVNITRGVVSAIAVAGAAAARARLVRSNSNMPASKTIAPSVDTAAAATETVAKITAGDKVDLEAEVEAEVEVKAEVAKVEVEKVEVAKVQVAETKAEETATIAEPVEAPPVVETSVVKEKVNWENLTSKKTLGAGTFGTVYLVQDKKTLKEYALKVLIKKQVKAKKQEKRVKLEKELLLTMCSEFVCGCYGAHDDQDGYYILMELIMGGELKRVIHSKVSLERQRQHELACRGKLAGISHEAAKFYCATLAIPLMYLHRQSIAYRDLKPENVMIDDLGYPKLVDFGLAKIIDDSGKTYSLCGTPEFLAPEVLGGMGHNQSVDWWALGCVLFEMIVGMTPFLNRRAPRNKQENIVIFQNIAENNVKYPKGIDPDCQKMIQGLLTSKPVLRLGCGGRHFNDVEEHPWFQDSIDWDALRQKHVKAPWLPSQTDEKGQRVELKHM